MYKSTTKCNETLGKWCKNKHGASKIIDTFEAYQFPTWLGKNEGIKKWMTLKNRRRSCSRFATNLVNQEWMRSSEREEKGALKTANMGERDRNHSGPCPRPTRLHTLRPPLRSYDQTRSRPVPRGPFLPAPHDAAPHDVAPHDAAPLVSTVRAPCEGFRQGLGENWGKTKELGKIEYN
jgi:hypothetical protein